MARKKVLNRFLVFAVAVWMASFGAVHASAPSFDALPAGSYPIGAELSCYINAMGGVEFGAPLLTSVQLNVGEDGSKTLTLHFTKSSVTIYGVTCDTFIDADPAYVTDTTGVVSGTIGYYDTNGALQTGGVSHTLSSDTALNAQSEEVHYVDSITFPVSYESGTYSLALYINSNVMGTQFTADKYPATLRVDWSTVLTGEEAESSAAPEISVTPEEIGAEANTPADSVAGSPTAGMEDGLDADRSEQSAVKDDSLEGLNIYHAEDTGENEPEASEDSDTPEKDPANEEDVVSEEDDHMPLIMGAIVVAVVLIITGGVLVGSDKKKKES